MSNNVTPVVFRWYLNDEKSAAPYFDQFWLFVDINIIINKIISKLVFSHGF